MSDTLEYRLFVYNLVRMKLCTLVGFVIFISILFMFPYRIMVFITIPLAIILIFFLFSRFGQKKITVYIENKALLINYYNLARTRVTSKKEIDFSNIKSVKKVKILNFDIIRLKQKKGKSIKFIKVYHLYPWKDDFIEFWLALKTNNFTHKSLIQTHSGQLFIISISIIALSIIALLLLDSIYKLIPGITIFFSMSMIYILFENQDK